jgi:hypothetical protein
MPGIRGRNSPNRCVPLWKVIEDHALPFAVDQVQHGLDRAAGSTGKIAPFIISKQ